MPVLAGGPEVRPPYAMAPDAEPSPSGNTTSVAPSAHAEPTLPAGPAEQTEQHAPAATAGAGAGPAPLAGAAPRAGGRSIAPVAMVRRLQRLQDAIAGGFAEGIPKQRALIAEMDEAFGAADPATWQDPKNARSLVMYFLSGGSPDVLRAIVMREPKPNIDEKLLVGSLLYLEGREDAALRELGEVDARKLPNGLAGQVALAQAALSVRADPVRSASLLELARLFLPGTLVDEAALRRSVLVAAQAGDMTTFERLATQYFHRFRHSAYAGNFRQRFAAALTRMSALSEPEGLNRLDALLAPLDEAAQREIFLLVARAAILEGKTKLATASAERALARAPQASSDAERARVYLSAADAATPDRFQSAAAQLKAVNRDRLDASDKALLEAASRTADLVRRADEAVPQQAAAPVPQPATAAPGEQKPSPALVKAQAKLQQIDKILKEAPR